MIKEISAQLAHNLGNRLEVDTEQVEIYAYGLEILIGVLLNVTVLFTLAGLLDLVYPTLLVLAACAVLRMPGGGAHMNAYHHCFIMGIILLLSLAALSTLDIPLPGQMVLLGLIAVVALYCIVFLVPAGTEKKNFTQPEVRRKQKLITASFFFIWLVSVLFSMNQGYNHSALALTLGAGAAVFAMTPPGYKAIASLDQALSRLERR